MEQDGILVVGPSSDKRKEWMQILSSVGSRVVEAPTRAEALALMRAEKFAIVLADSAVDAEDGGVSILRECNALHPDAAARPSFILVSRDFRVNVAEMLQLGAEAVFSPPVSASGLRRLAEEILPRDARWTRKSARTAIEVPISIRKSSGAAGSVSGWIEGKLINASRTGLQLEIPGCECRVGEKLQFALGGKSSPGKSTILGHMEIRWVPEGQRASRCGGMVYFYGPMDERSYYEFLNSCRIRPA